MLEIINLCELSKDSDSTNIRFDNKAIFIETKQVDNINYYSAINKIDYIQRALDVHKFKNLAELVTRISSNNIIYYGNINKDKKTFHISINKIDCYNFKEENILTIDTEIETSNTEYYDDLSLCSKLIGINERYAILFLPHFKYEYEQTFFKKALLIDSSETKAYTISDSILGLDNILRMDEINVICSGKYLILKTGEIRGIEKNQIWSEHQNNYKFTKCHEHLENLVICQVDDLICNIKNGFKLKKSSIIESCDLQSSLNIIHIDNNKIIYNVNYFKTKSTILKIYNYESRSTRTIELNTLYSSIMCFNEKIYGLKRNFGHLWIYNITDNNNTMFKIIDDGDIIYIDEDQYITIGINLENETIIRSLKVHDLRTGGISKVIKFKYYDFYSEKNTIVVF